MLDLLGPDISHVTGVNHKRHWHHVTNADHAEVTLTYRDGRQARFINSDLSAARRPKFYALGTAGAIVGEWDPAAEPAVADLPARLTLHVPGAAPQEIALDSPTPYAFHQQLGAFLANGDSMEVMPQQSRNVVSVMEAAEESARSGSTPVTPSII